MQKTPDFGPSARFLISGGTGFIGSALVRTLLEQGHHVCVLSRNPDRARRQFGGKVQAIGHCRELPDTRVFDVVVNLAGAPVVGPPWTKSRRHVLRESRLATTRQLLEYVQRCVARPRLWLQPSAIGYYGPHAPGECLETTPAGDGFAAELCRDWEAMSEHLPESGVRRVVFRFGLVFGRGGGAFPPLVLPFRFGLGAVIGDGEQYLAWIHRDDVIAAMAWAQREESVQGAYNLVAPEATTYRQFATQLGKTLHRPVFLRLPSPVLRLLLGEMASLLTEGPRIVPSRLVEAAYAFRHPDLESALQDLL